MSDYPTTPIDTGDGFIITRNQLHKTLPVHIHGNTVYVDEQIVPLVLWFNSIPNVTTYASCQGEFAPLALTSAYVFFSTNDDLGTLAMILDELQVYYYRDDVKCETGFNSIEPPRPPKLKHTLRFYKPGPLKSMVQFAKTQGYGDIIP